MPGAVRNTVERLDKPSAYYQNRVSYATLFLSHGIERRIDNEPSLPEQEAQVRQRP
jgi:hypothetical protein